MKTVLILEDDARLAESLQKEFHSKNCKVYLASSIKNMAPEAFDYAVVDLRLQGEFGLDAIEILKSRNPDCKIIILSGYGSIHTAVESIKRGASDFLCKPISFSHLWAALQGAFRSSTSNDKILTLSQMEHEHIDYVLIKNSGNITRSAKELGLHRQSLQRKLKKHTP